MLSSSQSRVLMPHVSNICESDFSIKYEVSNTIGKGAYATVYKGQDKHKKGRYVALKEVVIPTNLEEGFPTSALREIGLLKQIEKFNHPNIVKLLDVCLGLRNHHDMKLNLVFEHVNQDLSQYLAKVPSPGLTTDMIKSLMYQILSGLEFIHSHRILHRDLKPQNILITEMGVAKIADFGLAKLYSYQMALTSVVVTLFYRAPEILLNSTYSSAVDIWSVGCIFAEVHTQRPLFQGLSEIDQLAKIFECIGVPSEENWPENIGLTQSAFKHIPSKELKFLVPNAEPETLDLIKKMLVFKPDDRILARHSLDDPFFKDLELPQCLLNEDVSNNNHDQPQDVSSGNMNNSNDENDNQSHHLSYI